MGSVSLGFPPVGSGPKSPTGNQVYSQQAFGGAWTFPDKATVPSPFGILAQNCRFQPGGSIATRYGWGQAFQLTGENENYWVYSMFNWLSELGNYLIWLQPNSTSGATIGLRLANVSDNPPTAGFVETISVNTFGATYAPAGPRLYNAFWVDTLPLTSIPADSAHVLSYSGGWNADTIIPGPPSKAASAAGVQIPTTAPTEPGVGIVTAGLHNLGLRMLHRSGFLGRPGPDSSTTENPTPSTFAPIAFTSAGLKNINWTFTPTGTWPSDVIEVQIVMSPVSNPNRFFEVPGAVQAVTGGASTAVNVTINIDDATLIAGAELLECTNSLNWYTASSLGAAYMKVSAVSVIGNRMFYVSEDTDDNGNTFSVVYASDPFEYQQITRDQHQIQLPGQLKITRVFGVQGSIYIGGPHWTYATQDTGGVPINWPLPQLVDGRRGVPYPNCIEIETSGKYAWVADKTGLYYFDGSYATVPISDNQRDLWSQVSFGFGLMTIKDNPISHKVHVFSGGGAPMLVWDYTNGTSPNQANFSAQTPPNISSSIEMVQNDLAGVSSSVRTSKELWFGPTHPVGGTSIFYREMNPLAGDTNVYRDMTFTGANAAIHAICEYVLPSGGTFNALSHVGCKMRVTGDGAFQPSVYTFDKGSSILLRPAIADLSANPDGRQQFWGYLVTQNGVVYHIEQNVLDGFFVLSGIDMVYNTFGSLL